VPNKIQLGVNLTEGLMQEQILMDNSQLLKVSLTSKNVDRNTKMVLLLPEWVVVQAGAAPVIAIKEREILL
jgi:hypothetical protein